MTRRRGRRRKKLLDDLKDRRGYCQLKEEALDRTVWRNRFGRGFGPVISQITDDDDDTSVCGQSLSSGLLSKPPVHIMPHVLPVLSHLIHLTQHYWERIECGVIAVLPCRLL